MTFGSCMKYEQLYDGPCWDYLLWITGCEAYSDFKSIPEILTENLGVEITNPLEFGERLKLVFERMHEDGIIKPAVREPLGPEEDIDE